MDISPLQSDTGLLLSATAGLIATVTSPTRTLLETLVVDTPRGLRTGCQTVWIDRRPQPMGTSSSGVSSWRA